MCISRCSLICLKQTDCLLLLSGQFWGITDLEKDDSGEYLESPVSDGTIDENFEEQLGFDSSLAKLPIENGEEAIDYSDVAKYGIVEVAGWFEILLSFANSRVLT